MSVDADQTTVAEPLIFPLCCACREVPFRSNDCECFLYVNYFFSNKLI
jgi:hypothetical protein